MTLKSHYTIPYWGPYVDTIPVSIGGTLYTIVLVRFRGSNSCYTKEFWGVYITIKLRGMDAPIHVAIIVVRYWGFEKPL
jgi:hypothetical protein